MTYKMLSSKTSISRWFCVLAAAILLSGCSGSENINNPDLPADTENPLPECPDSPNCVRYSIMVEVTADKTFEYVGMVLEEMGVHEVEKNRKDNTINSVFRIPIMGFKDDFDVVMEAQGNQSLVHIRSASRTGYSDLGVNERRVKKFVKNLREQL